MVLSPQRGGLQIVHDLRRGRHAEGVDDHLLAAQDAGELEEIAGLAAGAGADVGAVELDVAEFLGQLALAGVRVAGDRRFELREIHDRLVDELLILVALDRARRSAWCR